MTEFTYDETVFISDVLRDYFGEGLRAIYDESWVAKRVLDKLGLLEEREEDPMAMGIREMMRYEGEKDGNSYK